MVALAGKGWRLAPSLAAMVREADRIAPRRSERSDGSIGDWLHRLRRSHHNPSGGFVDAVDLTHDPAHGFDAHARARAVASRRDPRIDEIISNRRKWTHGSGWRLYLGINGHTSHVHFGVKRNSAGRASTTSWWSGAAPAPTPAPEPDPQPPEDDDDMAAPYSLWQLSGSTKVYRVAADGQSAQHVGDLNDLRADIDLLTKGGWPSGIIIARKPNTSKDPDYFGWLSRIIAAPGSTP